MDPKEWKKLVQAVFALRGSRCQNCKSERDLMVYQYRWAPEDDKPPEAFIVLCEPCKVKRQASDMEANRDDWIISFGKYKRSRISECPIGYLDWLMGQDWLRAGLRSKIETYLEGCGEWQRM